MSEPQTTQGLPSNKVKGQLTSKEISAFLNRIAEFTEALKVPHTIFISDLRHDKYKLTQPIPVSIEYEDDTVIVSFYDVDVYGTGDDIQEAITDLCSQIIEVYELYSQNVNRLGPVPTREWKYLQTIVRPID
ncbi:hypothetical protein FJZ31_01370 [Candidatus Poribacteria bacterium]|nr:hypothetical protein [Candidatus Poribacteria bacterium]